MPQIDWITTEYLATFYGAVFITNLITHFIKDYMPDALDKKITTLFVAIIATVAVYGKIKL
ncbi:hypothetical protein F8154_08520, partial [Alkaliphilus pronyensis]